MTTFIYPSKEFSSAWRKAVDDNVGFSIDAKIGGLRKKSVIHWLDAIFLRQRPRRRYGSIGAMFCGELTSCIARVFSIGRYRAEYLKTDRGLLIKFTRC